MLFLILLGGWLVLNSPKSVLKEDFLYLDKQLNRENLYNALVYYNVQYPEIVLAQAILESGNFTSDLCVSKNNFLGLYNSSKKEFYNFDHWTDCIIAYKNKIQYRLKENEDYYHFLKRIKYARDLNYIKKVKQIESTL